MLTLAGVAATIGADAAGFDAPSPGWMAAFGALTLLLFVRLGLYAPRLRLRTLDDIPAVGLAVTVAAMAVVTIQVIADDAPTAAEAVRPWAFALVYLAAGRVALSWSRARAREHGEGVRRTLVVGAGRIGCLTAKRLLEAPQLGLEPVAFLDKDPLADTEEAVGLPVAGASWDLDDVVAQYGVEHVVITFSTAPEEVLLRIVRRSEELGLGVSVVPRLFERMPGRLTVDHVGGLPLITPRPAEPRDFYLDVKYTVDRIVAATTLLLLAPVLLAVAALVRVTMGRPIFFRQPRVGRDGQVFEMLKFRSMTGTPEEHGEADADWAAGETNGCGPEAAVSSPCTRITPVGRVLRKLSLDELPQLWNVLRGQMSIVGPRPERPDFVSQFERSVYRYADRHRVKSGITGWAQVHGLRGKTSIADRAEWDNFYIENYSFGLDLKILLLTVGAVFRSVDKVE
jgi:exopolysaccharide biosynthesis polyprenyl glycosylphosphotransferase